MGHPNHWPFKKANFLAWNHSTILQVEFVPLAEVPPRKQSIQFNITNMNILLLYSWWLSVLVTQSCPSLCNPVDSSSPVSSVHGILQARMLEWVAILFSGGSSWARGQTRVSRIAGRFFTSWATREALLTTWECAATQVAHSEYHTVEGEPWKCGQLTGSREQRGHHLLLNRHPDQTHDLSQPMTLRSWHGPFRWTLVPTTTRLIPMISGSAGGRAWSRCVIPPHTACRRV